MKRISVIRDRGQVTIPEAIRRIASWASPSSAISISMENPDEIRIRPHRQQLNWDEIWANIGKARSVLGKGKMSAAKFLERDRQVH